MNRRLFPELMCVVTVLAAIMVLTGRAEDLPEVDLEPGQATYIKWRGLGFRLPIFLPEDFDPAKKWPVMLWYHGTNGDASVDFIRQLADRKNWVIVGMTYLDQGQFQYNTDNLAAEMGLYQDLRRELARQVPIDEDRVYVGGFSKGGWMSALFVEKDPALAGAVVLGAGVFDRPRESRPRPFQQSKSIFVGIGEQDPNMAMGHRAKSHFEGLGARVTREIWPDLGHEKPETSLFLTQWLRMRGAPKQTGSDGGPNPLRSEAEQWYAAEQKRIGGLDGSVSRYFALKKLAESPFAVGLGKDPLETITAALADGTLPPELSDEIEADRRYHEILDKESSDRFLDTLVDANKAYAKLAKELPETRFGKRAAIAEARTLELLKSASGQ